MTVLDWLIVAALAAVILGVGVHLRRYVCDIASYLAAGRTAGRYLGVVAGGAAGTCAITILAFFQLYYESGFASYWWGLVSMPISVAVALTGWGVYRLRQTRVLTIAELLERRYSRRFRIFCGLLSFFAGIINFGIFPICGARFFIYFCGLPPSVSIGGVTCSTLFLIMTVLVGLSLLLCLAGGQITLIVTDFLQGALMNGVLMIIAYVILVRVPWHDLIAGFMASADGERMLHPFRMQFSQQFNLLFFFSTYFFIVYNVLSWTPSAVQNCSAKSAYEARMMAVLNVFKGMGMMVGIPLMAFAAFAILHHAGYAGIASRAQEVLAAITDAQTRSQMTVPVVMRFLLPAGILGALTALVLFAFISTHDSYLLVWGSVLIQDVIVPWRGKPLAPRTHLLALRAASVGVAVFIIAFSWFFRQTEHILMFMNVTGAIYTGGAGAVILGALYWPRGSTRAAWTAMMLGTALALFGVVYKPYVHPVLHSVLVAVPPATAALDALASISGNTWAVTASLAALASYIIVSLLDPAPRQLLPPAAAAPPHELALQSRGDRWLYRIVIAYAGIYMLAFAIVTAYNLVRPVATSAWVAYWRFSTYLSVALGTLVCIWFTVGGTRDLVRLLRDLRAYKADAHDDGFVSSPS